jgi:uncharacterized protein (TIGR02597 family)
MKNSPVRVASPWALVVTLIFVLGGFNVARATVMVAANVYQSPTIGTTTTENITLTNTSTSGETVSEFWFASAPGQNYMAASPTNIKAPANWTFTVVNNGANDGFSIHFVAASGSALAPSTTVPPAPPTSLSGFSFQTTATLEGNDVNYGLSILTSTVVLTDTSTSPVTATLSFVTASEGAMTYTFTSAQSTYFSLPLTDDPIYSDVVAQVSTSQGSTFSDTISVGNSTAFDAANTTTVEALEQPASRIPYYVKFLSGAQAGRVLLIIANTATTLTLDLTDHTGSSPVALNGNTTSQATGLPLFNVAVGDAFEVIPGRTLATMFGGVVNGTTYPLVVTGNTSLNLRLADTISFPTTSTGPRTAYFFNAVSVTAGHWQEVNTTNTSPNGADDTPVYPNSPLSITVRSSSPNVTLVLSGRSAEVPMLAKAPADSVFSSSTSAADIVLGNLTLGSNWAQNNFLRNADTLGVYAGSGNPPPLSSYYQNGSGAWLNVATGAPASAATIPAGSVLILTQRGSVSGPATYLQFPTP